MINNRQNGRRRGRGGGQGAPRPNGSNGGQDRGNRIDNRARGNAAQLLEKYKALARDAQMQGDRVNTEYYLQFADHYFRVLSESRSRFEDQQPRPRRDEYVAHADEEYGDEGERVGNGLQDERPQPEAREAVPAVDGGDRQRETERAEQPAQEERRPRRGRPPRDAQPREFQPRDVQPRDTQRDEEPEQLPAEPAPVAVPSGEEQPQPRRRGRPPKVRPVEQAAEPVSEQIDVDRLPPSFSLQIQGDEGEAPVEKPRRTRRPRGETAAA